MENLLKLIERKTDTLYEILFVRNSTPKRVEFALVDAEDGTQGYFEIIYSSFSNKWKLFNFKNTMFACTDYQFYEKFVKVIEQCCLESEE